MDEEGLRKAEAMLKDAENYPLVGDVIDQLKIGRTAFYRYFPPDRIKELRRVKASDLLPNPKAASQLTRRQGAEETRRSMPVSSPRA